MSTKSLAPPPECTNDQLICSDGECSCVAFPPPPPAPESTSDGSSSDGASDFVDIEPDFPRILDTVGPVLQLLGGGEVIETEEGISQMIHYVTVGDEWVDPGINVTDNFDADMNKIYVPEAVVDTSVPTLPNAPKVLSFSLVDAAGNPSNVVQRLLHIRCPVGESMCEGTAFEPEPSCSFLGFCGLSNMLDDLFDQTSAEPVIRVVLDGPELVEVPKGTAWAKCRPEAAPLDLCDRGAKAFLGEDDPVATGSLTAYVTACGDSLFTLDGVQACEFNPDVPGPYEVHFSVREPNGQATVVDATRVVWVLPECLPSERICNNRISCSEDQVCRDGSSVELPGVLEEGSEQRAAPRIALAGSLGAFVEVPQYSPYAACEPGRTGTPRRPCEEGAIATDEVDGSLTSGVFILPGSNVSASVCVERGCSGFEFWHRGVDPAWVNTSEAPGTVSTLTFVAVNSAGVMSSVNRTVTVGDPCARGYSYCDGACYPADCDLLPLIGIDTSAAPSTVDVVGDALLHVGYGLRLSTPTSLMPCDMAVEAEQKSCGAYATDTNGTDLSGSLRVMETTPCADGEKCWYCHPSLVGSTDDPCMPGQYTYMYYVMDSRGALVTSLRTVVIEEARHVVLVLELETGDMSNEQAAQIAFKLQDPIEDANSALRSSFAAAVNEAYPGFSMNPGHVLVTEATPRAVTPVDAEGRATYKIVVLLDVMVPFALLSESSVRRSLLQGSVDEILASISEAGSSTGFLKSLSQQQDLAAVANASAVPQQESLEPLTPVLDLNAGEITSLASEVEMLVESVNSMQSRLGRAEASLMDRLLESPDFSDAAARVRSQEISEAYGVMVSEHLNSSQLLMDDLEQVQAKLDMSMEQQAELLGALSSTANSIKEGIAAAQQFARSLAETQEFLENVRAPRPLPTERGAQSASCSSVWNERAEPSIGRRMGEEEWGALSDFMDGGLEQSPRLGFSDRSFLAAFSGDYHRRLYWGLRG
uniref:Uncharacterized protein n=1 Tax=Tetraselmis sp. GSL018 TaxID=582737 RepID=A0A061RKA2_9CHLO